MTCSRGCCPTQADHFRSLGVLGKRSGDVIREGKSHPDSGKPWKSVTTEAGTVTEHSGGRAPGVSDRQDVNITPQVVRMSIGVNGNGVD